jgi:hypothetical protein
MANVLVGFRYIQDDDPGIPPSGGYEWYKLSTGELFIRDPANTEWLTVGQGSETNLGLVPTTGATMSGELMGVTGWAPQSAPDFSTSAKRDGIDLATKGDISALRRELITRFNTISSEILANAAATSGIKQQIAIKTGINTYDANVDFTIPLPQYNGGTGDTALRAEVICHAAWPILATTPGGEGIARFNVYLVDETTMKYHMEAGYAPGYGPNLSYGIQCGWIVVAMR